MNEQEYMSATNLAKARIARHCITDLLYMDDERIKIVVKILLALDELIEHHEKEVSS